MRATIQNNIFYDDIPSASGIEMAGDFYYVIGDDSPYLYKLDRSFKLVERIVLTDTATFKSGRVAKGEKLDLEGITSFNLDNKFFLLMLGSGSGPMRNSGYLAEIPSSTSGQVSAFKFKLDPIYQHLQSDKEIVEEGLLNIEGVAVGDDRLYLLQRGIGNGKNVLLSYDLKAFYSYISYTAPVNEASPSSGNNQDASGAVNNSSLKRTPPELPVPEKYYFNLPLLGKLQAGFSGAYFFDNKLFFTASLEDTQDAVNDGEVFGSYIGYIPLEALTASSPAVIDVPAAVITRPDGATYPGKVESLVVLDRGAGGKRYKVIVVSDDDKGNSELLEIQVRAI